MAMKSREKTLGWRDIASERRRPLSTSPRSSEMTMASFLSSVCSSRITSAVTTLSPASIIVANWREKIWSDLALTFLTASAPLFPAASCEASSVASRPRRRSCSRAADRSGALISPVSSEPAALIAV